MTEIPELEYNSDGLIPVVVQDCRTNEVLMMAYSNREAVERMFETGYTCFWSRSRQKLWKKGEESGNVQRIRSIQADCDRDTLLVRVEQTGAACHTGRPTCFNDLIYGELAETAAVIPELYRIINDRKANPLDESYTCKLFRNETKMCKKVVEEAAEVVLAVKDHDGDELAGEVADLFYHTLVLMVKEDLDPERIYRELWERNQ